MNAHAAAAGYRPFDEVIQSPAMRLLRALSRFDQASVDELFTAVAVRGTDVDRRDYNAHSSALSRAVRTGLVERIMRPWRDHRDVARIEHVLRITAAGRAHLARLLAPDTAVIE